MEKPKYRKSPAEDGWDGLKMVNFQVPPKLYAKFRTKVVKARLTVRAVMTALLSAYVEGDFELVEEKKAGSKKG
jgi:hypothetical protein